MKKIVIFLIVTIISVVAGYAQDVKWPRQLTHGGDVLTVYQPQVHTWDKHQHIDFRTAFSLVPSGGKEVLGVLYMEARTNTDIESHIVKVDSMRIKDVHFPSLPPDSVKLMAQRVRQFLTPDRFLLISVEQIVTYLENDSLHADEGMKNDPPLIFVSKKPAVLLQLEGPAMTASAGNQNLEYVYNANLPLFLHKPAGVYYLFDGLEWQKSTSVRGPWSFTAKLPDEMNKLIKDSAWMQLSSIIPAKTSPDKNMPEVFFAESPAELIVFKGEPAYASISGTQLKYPTNTTAELFVHNTSKQYFILTSGRWFSATNFSGPWTYASAALPADFKKIPENSTKGWVLAYVPGTYQARDAALIAMIPVSATVNAREAEKAVKIVYQGDPLFKPIESTNLFYAVNTMDKVIKVSTNEYYACVNGIWFVGSNPNGPWKTAEKIPSAIYSIPPSSPVYNVTYVNQTVVNNTYVTSSYTSGYMGVYLAPTPYGVVVISGTGYYHPPYYYYPPYGYPVCMHYYPVTYGCYAYKPYPYGGVSYKAAYNPYTGTYGRSATAYGPYGSATAAQAFNPYTGTYARGASVSTAYGSASAAQAYNPYTGASAATRQGSNPYGQWGSTAVTNGSGDWARAGHTTTSNGTLAATQTSKGGQAVAASGNQGNSGGVAKTASGDVYASANGNVYKKSGDSWQQYGSDGWSSTQGAKAQQASSANSTTTAATQQNRSSQQTGTTSGSKQFTPPAGGGFGNQQMNSEYQNRQRGNYQTQQFSNRSAGANRSGGGGGRRR